MASNEGTNAPTESDAPLSDEQLQSVAGGLRNSVKEEFSKSAGEKGISGRIKEEFEEGLGNKAYSEEDLRDQVGNG